MANVVRFLPVVLAAAGFLTVDVKAGTILYDNIGPGYPLAATTGYGSGGPFFGTTFTASEGGSLTEVMIGVGSDTFTSAPLGLYADSGGEPGTLLESWNVTLPFSLNNLVTLTSVLNPVLDAGAQYWLVFGPSPNGVLWAGNDTGVLGAPWQGATLTSLTTSVNPTSPALGAALIGTSSVPEPATGGLMLAACLTLAALRTVRR